MNLTVRLLYRRAWCKTLTRRSALVIAQLCCNDSNLLLCYGCLAKMATSQAQVCNANLINSCRQPCWHLCYQSLEFCRRPSFYPRIQANASAANHTLRAFYTLIAKGIEAMFWATPLGTIFTTWHHLYVHELAGCSHRLLMHNTASCMMMLIMTCRQSERPACQSVLSLR